MGAALATPAPAVKTTVIVIAPTTRPTRTRDIATSLLLPLWGDVRVRARDRYGGLGGAMNAAAAATATRIATPNQVFHFLAMRHPTPRRHPPRIPSRRRRRIDPRAFYAIESSPFGRWSEAVPLLLRVVRVVVIAVALAEAGLIRGEELASQFVSLTFGQQARAAWHRPVDRQLRRLLR